jgi:hypothetical protein
VNRILTVTSPAASKLLTSLVTVRQELGITSSANDAQLTRYILAASRAAAHKCNGELVLEGVTEQFRPYPFIDSASLTNAPEFIHLRRTPVAEIVSVTEDDRTLLQDTDFEIDSRLGRLTRLYSDLPMRWHFRKLVVVYTGGYAPPIGDSEPDLEQAAIEIVKDMWSAKARDPLIRSEEATGIFRTEYWVGSLGEDGGWPPKVTDLLAPYQRPKF